MHAIELIGMVRTKNPSLLVPEQVGQMGNARDTVLVVLDLLLAKVQK